MINIIQNFTQALQNEAKKASKSLKYILPMNCLEKL